MQMKPTLETISLAQNTWLLCIHPSATQGMSLHFLALKQRVWCVRKRKDQKPREARTDLIYHFKVNGQSCAGIQATNFPLRGSSNSKLLHRIKKKAAFLPLAAGRGSLCHTLSRGTSNSRHSGSVIFWV